MADPEGWHDWHGRIGGRIHPKSHVVGSEWNMKNREAAKKANKKKTAKRTNVQRNVSRRNNSHSRY